MKSFSKHILVFLASFLYCSLGLSPVYAEDTEIFVGGASSGSGVKPNVLFILDNSGSMNSYLGAGKTRLETMKESFSDIINSVSGVNVGIMRFNAPGGSVLYPVTNIDEVVATATIETIETPELASNDDDAVEHDTTGIITLNGTELTLGGIPGSSSASVTVQSDIGSDLNNAFQSYSYMYTTKKILYVYNSSSYNETTGVRFENLNIPAGATIQSAYIRFTSKRDSTGSMTINVAGESTNDPDAFSIADNDISDRSTTTTSVDWPITSTWQKKDTYTTPDIAAVVQEIIDHTSWSPNDALAFILTKIAGSSSNTRSFFSWHSDKSNTQGITGRGPVLTVTYTTTGGPVASQTTALRFNNVAVPKGATVTNAYINFTAVDTSSTTANLTVQIENTSDASTFSSSNNDISDRTLFSDIVSWNLTESWTADQIENGPVVTTLIQRVVDDAANWCGNNAIAFYISGTDVANRRVYAYDAGLDRQPKLVVEYTFDSATAPPTDGCINPVVSIKVQNTEDDADERIQSGSDPVNNYRDRVIMNDDYRSGYRFTEIPVNRGATIESAYIEFTAYPYGESGYSEDASSNTGSNITLTFAADDTNNSNAIPSSSDNLKNRTTTTATVAWNPDDWNIWEKYRSPDISSLLQEVVDRSGWSPGNAFTVIMTGSGSDNRAALSFDGSPGNAAKLVFKITYGGLDGGETTVRDIIDETVQAMEGRTWTPIVDTLYEAALYMKGENVYYGKARGLFSPRDGSTSKKYKRVSVEDSYTGGSHTLPTNCPATDSSSSYCSNEVITGSPVYISPMTDACQTNHIVLLTDGEANNFHTQTRDGDSGTDGPTPGILSMAGIGSCMTASYEQSCARDLAEYLSTEDQATGFPSTNNTIKTHTIAFNLSDDASSRTFLQELAETYGDGLYKEVDTAAELVSAFDEILRSVITTAATFVSPGATVNQFNRLTHRSDIYFSLFKPDSSPQWTGNLKRYHLLGDNSVISDANDAVAVDSNTGFFKETSKSFWSTLTDGNDVMLGGAANMIPTEVERNIYTYYSGSASKDLTNTVNQFADTNANITTTMLSGVSSAKRTSILRWARGIDLLDDDGDGDTSDDRNHMGDPLHSIPHIVTYGEDDSDIVVYFGTNEGFLHAISADTGVEKFAFVPEATMSNLEEFYDNSSAFTHPYGLDGSVVSLIYDADYDGEIENADHVYIYFGMRRGGNNYYALDVSNPDSPDVLFTIEGGSGDFTELGQTWSTPVVAKINIGGTKTDVLIFAGGYDVNQDSVSVRTADSIGRAIYIVNAETGARIWWASNSATALEGLKTTDMNYSIPSDIQVVDLNLDGLADQFYVGDMGGQVWRFDIDNGASAANLVDGGVIADLAGSTASSNRRFFNAPDLSLVAHQNNIAIAVSIGSGYRAHPLNKIVEDRHYAFRQTNVYVAPSSYVAIEESDLYDVTNIPTPTSSQADNIADADGWYLRLTNAGEKVLSTSVTVNNMIIFTTYQPDSVANSCSAVNGTGRVYIVSVFDASPTEDLDESGDIDSTSDRSRILQSGSIPPAPKILLPEGGAPTVLIGPEQPLGDINLNTIDEWQRTYWYEQ